MTIRSIRSPLLLALAAGLVVSASGCGLVGDPVAGSDSRALDAGTPPSASTTAAPVELEPVVQPEDPACAPGEGKQVEELDDVAIPAFSVDTFEVPDEQLGDVVVPGFTVPGFALPATTVEAGCIVRYDAPGACLGAVEIVGVELPGARVPQAEIPPVVVDGQTLFEGDASDGDVSDGDASDGGRVEQTCQDEPAASGDDFVSSVFRGTVFRGTVFRGSLYRGSLTRPRICVEADGREQCTASVIVPALTVPSVTLPSTTVESASLPSFTVVGAPDTTVFTGETEESYVTPAEVLFDFDESEIKPEAAASLTAIAAKIGPGATVVVEGHTDDQGTDAYNQTLSEARADAVAAWLVANGGVASGSVSTKGLGESAPATSNSDEAGRAQNRRVVITVTTS